MIGHGTPGLRSGLRPFSDFIDSSDTQKQILAEVRAGLVLGIISGDLPGNDVYVGNVGSYLLNDVLIDVVGVKTGLGSLTRVQSLAECRATANTYWYDPDDMSALVNQNAPAKWDDGANTWDGAHKWDESLGPSIWIHPSLPFTANVDVVSLELGFYFSSYGETHPALSGEFLANSDFESWASASDATGWTEAVSTAAMTVAQEATLVKSGTYSVKLAAVSNVAAEQYAEESVQLTNLIVGKVYRLSGDYLTSQDVTDGGTTRPCILVGSTAGGIYLPKDGRNPTATGSYWSENPTFLNATGGEWRRFMFDFIATHTTMQVRLRHEKQSGTLIAGSYTIFDNVSLKRVWRFVTYEPALSSSSIPASETGSNDVFFGGKRIGSGSITLDNANGRLERIVGQLDWLNKEVRVYFGGKFADGQELLFDDYRRGFTGLTQSVNVTDVEIRFDMEDVRIFFHQRMPPNLYDDTVFPDLDTRKFQGKARPMFFGVKQNITPARVAYSNQVDGLGTYEIADCSFSPAGLKEITAVYAYEDQEAADRHDVSRRLTSEYRPTLPVFTGVNVLISGQNHLKGNSGGGWGSNGAHANSSDGTFTSGSYTIAEYTNGGGDHAFGIVKASGDWNYTSMDYCWLHSTEGGASIGEAYRIFEANVLKFTTAALSERGDILQIRLLNGVVTYWLNGVLIYTSLTAASGTYYMRASMRSSGPLLGGVRLRRKTDTYHTTDLVNGRFTLTYDIGPYRVVDGTNRGSYNDAGGERIFKIPAGMYSAADLQILLGSAMVAVSSVSDPYYLCSQTARVFTVYNTNGINFYPMTSTGADKGLWPLYGFTGANRASGLTHVADVQLFEDADSHSTIRVDAKGYADDSAGTYTGVAGALIERGESITKFIFTRILKKPLELVDTASFLFAAGRAPEALAIYADDLTTTKEVFDTLEYSNVANIVVDGEGRIFYFVYIGDVPAGISDFFKFDFLSFEAEQSVVDVYQSVKVWYDEDPSTNEYEGRASTDASTYVRFGRPDYREFKTYIKMADNAQSLADRLKELAKRPPRKIKFSSKGKLIDKKVGDKIRVTRDRALDPSGKLSAQVVRILSLAHDYRAGESTCECVDDVVTVAGVVCLTTCQATCEFTCQTGCQSACQAACELSCQNACESACQQACETKCQASCQLSCQTTCEFTCQAACQLACQTVCQGSCQGACQGGGCQNVCESSCQTTCQVGCQTGCQVNCQTTCQLACQTGCQVSCQYTCQVACQVGCEVTCQTSCETTCQTGCEVSCQTTCQTSCQTSCQYNCETISERKNQM